MTSRTLPSSHHPLNLTTQFSSSVSPSHGHHSHRRVLAATQEEPPSPIAFAERQVYDEETYSHSSQRTRERDKHSIERKSSGRRPSLPPTESSTDDKRSLGAASDHTKPRKRSIFKRVIKELTGGAKDLIESSSPYEVTKEKSANVSYGRGGAGRVKIKSKSTPKAVPTSAVSLPQTIEDDMRSLKSASSAVVTKSPKPSTSTSTRKQPVYDPYLKSFVSPKGELVPPLPSLPLPKHHQHSAPPSIYSPPPTSSRRRGPGSTTTETTTTTTPDAFSDWTPTSTPRTGTGTTWESPTTNEGWQSSLRASRSRKLPTFQEDDLDVDDLSSMMTDQRSPMSSGPASPVSRTMDRLGSRRPSELSLDLLSASGAPAPTPNPMLLTPMTPGFNSMLAPVPLDYNALQTLYATLLAQQASALPPLHHPQPIIPPQLASNVDSIVALAASYQQLLNSFATTSLAGTSVAGFPTFPNHQSASTPIPISVGSQGTTLLGRKESFKGSGGVKTSTASVNSSPGSASALSPPPRHRQVRTAPPLRKGSLPPSGSGPTSTSTPASSPDDHALAGTSSWMIQRPTPVVVEPTSVKPVEVEEQEPHPPTITGAHRSITPVWLSDSGDDHDHERILSSRLSFSSNATGSPSCEHPEWGVLPEIEPSTSPSTNLAVPRPRGNDPPRPRPDSSVMGHYQYLSITPAMAMAPLPLPTTESPASMRAGSIPGPSDESESSNWSTPISDGRHEGEGEGIEGLDLDLDRKLMDLLGEAVGEPRIASASRQNSEGSSGAYANVDGEYSLVRERLQSPPPSSISETPKRKNTLPVRRVSTNATPVLAPHTNNTIDSNRLAAPSLHLQTTTSSSNNSNSRHTVPSPLSLSGDSPFIPPSTTNGRPIRQAPAPVPSRDSPPVAPFTTTDFGFPLPPAGLPVATKKDGTGTPAWVTTPTAAPRGGGPSSRHHPVQSQLPF